MSKHKSFMFDASPNLSHVETWVFDLDNTLYPAETNLFAQVDIRMTDFITHTLDMGFDEARALQKKYYKEQGTTLEGLRRFHNIAPKDFLDYVHDIDVSKVTPCKELDRLLGALPGRKLVYTNGSEAHAERVTAALEVDHHFDEIYDIVAVDYEPKHREGAFNKFVSDANFKPSTAAMFDDIAKNLLPASHLGFTTIWIRHTSDVQERVDPHAPVMESTEHVHFEAPDLLSFLRQMRHSASPCIMDAGQG